MNYQQVRDDTNYSVRTQISLSPSLYKLVKEWAKREKRSMSAVVRKVLVERIKRSEVEKVAKQKRLEELVQRTKGMIKPGDGGWGDVKDPNKLIRQWRKEEDEVLAKRLGWDE